MTGKAVQILDMFLHKQCDLERTKFAYDANEVWEAVRIARDALLFGTDINVGWIPCSEEMPPLRERVLLTVYVECGYFNVEIAEYFGDYDWLFDDDCYSYTSAKWEVIAWQPLPEPFKPKGEK